MVDAVVRELWMVSGGASLALLGWASFQMARLTRRSGTSPARSWFLVFLAAMAGVAAAGLAGAAPLDLPTLLVGACLFIGGYALHRAAQAQGTVLAAQARGASAGNAPAGGAPATEAETAQEVARGGP